MIAVVGGGMSGCAAGSSLARAGKGVVVFHNGAVMGGNLVSDARARMSEDADGPLTRFPANHTETKTTAHRLGLTTYDRCTYSRDQLVRFEGIVRPEREWREIVSERQIFEGADREQNPRVLLSKWFYDEVGARLAASDEEVLSDYSRWTPFLHRLNCRDLATSLRERFGPRGAALIAVMAGLRLEVKQGLVTGYVAHLALREGRHLEIAGGLHQVPERLVAEIQEHGGNVCTRTTVTAVEVREDGVIISWTERGVSKKRLFDRCLIAVAPDELDHIRFSPPLEDDRAAALRQFERVPRARILFQCSMRPWELEGWFGTWFSDGLISWFAPCADNVRPVPGHNRVGPVTGEERWAWRTEDLEVVSTARSRRRGSITGFSLGMHAEHLLNLPQELAQLEVVEALRQMCPGAVDRLERVAIYRDVDRTVIGPGRGDVTPAEGALLSAPHPRDLPSVFFALEPCWCCGGFLESSLAAAKFAAEAVLSYPASCTPKKKEPRNT